MTLPLHARLAEDERPEPAQLIDFAVEIDTISEVQAGICQIDFPGKFRLSCTWHRNAIEIESIEQRQWRGRHAIWIGIDGDPDPDTQWAARLLREHFASPAGQRRLRDECDDQETNRRGDE